MPLQRVPPGKFSLFATPTPEEPVRIPAIVALLIDRAGANDNQVISIIRAKAKKDAGPDWDPDGSYWHRDLLANRSRGFLCGRSPKPPVGDSEGKDKIHHNHSKWPSSSSSSSSKEAKVRIVSGPDSAAPVPCARPLVVAAYVGRGPGVITALIDAGARPDARWDPWDPLQPHPLHVASRHSGQPEVAEAIIRGLRSRAAAGAGDRSPWAIGGRDQPSGWAGKGARNGGSPFRFWRRQSTPAERLEDESRDVAAGAVVAAASGTGSRTDMLELLLNAHRFPKGSDGIYGGKLSCVNALVERRLALVLAVATAGRGRMRKLAEKEKSRVLATLDWLLAEDRAADEAARKRDEKKKKKKKKKKKEEEEEKSGERGEGEQDNSADSDDLEEADDADVAIDIDAQASSTLPARLRGRGAVDVNLTGTLTAYHLAVASRATHGKDAPLEDLLRRRGARQSRTALSHLFFLCAMLVSVFNIVQLSSVPFVAGNPWPRSYSRVTQFFRFVLLDVDRLDIVEFRVIHATVCGLAALFVAFFLLQAETAWLLPVLFPLGWIVSTIAAMPMMFVFASVFDCTRDRETGTFHLDATGGERECFDTVHALQMAATAILIWPFFMAVVRLQRLDGFWNRMDPPSGGPLQRLSHLVPAMSCCAAKGTKKKRGTGKGNQNRRYGADTGKGDDALYDGDKRDDDDDADDGHDDDDDDDDDDDGTHRGLALCALPLAWSGDDTRSDPTHSHFLRRYGHLVGAQTVTSVLLQVVAVAASVALSEHLKILCGVNIAVALSFLASSLVHPAFINENVNAVHTGGFTGVLWCNAVAAITLAANGDNDSSGADVEDDYPVPLYAFLGVYVLCIGIGAGLYIAAYRMPVFQRRLEVRESAAKVDADGIAAEISGHPRCGAVPVSATEANALWTASVESGGPAAPSLKSAGEKRRNKMAAGGKIDATETATETEDTTEMDAKSMATRSELSDVGSASEIGSDDGRGRSATATDASAYDSEGNDDEASQLSIMSTVFSLFGGTTTTSATKKAKRSARSKGGT